MFNPGILNKIGLTSITGFHVIYDLCIWFNLFFWVLVFYIRLPRKGTCTYFVLVRVPFLCHP